MSFDGDIALPLLGVSGATGMDCDISVPVLSVSGSLGMSGSVPLPIMTISGKMRDIINGEVRLYRVQFDGEIGVSARIDGDVRIPCVSMRGDMQSEGDIVLSALRIFGQMTQYGVISGNLRIPSIRIQGAVRHEVAISGSIVLPAISLAGAASASSGVVIDGAVDVQLIKILGVMSPYEDFSFGSESDATLRHSASRRRI